MDYKLEEYIVDYRSVKINDVDVTVSMARGQKIVRCKDCRFYHDDYGYCEYWGDVFHHWEGHDRIDKDGFCDKGERKTDE